MAILCGPVTDTISYVSKLICNHLVKIYDIKPIYPDIIDILVDNRMIPAVGDASIIFDNYRVHVSLISKNAAAGTATISFAIESIEVPPPPEAATHYLDLYVKPYSWYTPSGAADHIATRLGDINGAILNLFSSIGISDYKYIGTEVLNEPNKPNLVTIRIKLIQMSAMDIYSMAVPLLAYIAAIVASVLVIIIVIGVITGWKFTLAGLIEQITGKEFSKIDVTNIVEDKVIPEQIKKCREQFANDPAGLARCEKAVLSGAADGITDALGLTGTDSITLGIDPKIDACLAQYNIDKDLNKYYSCLDKVAKDAGDETKAKTPKEGVGIAGTLILGAFLLGGLYIISKG